MARRWASAASAALVLQALGGCALLAGADDWSAAPDAASSGGPVAVGGSGGVVGDGGLGGEGGRGGAADEPVPGNATCADEVLNGLETDVDCGGDACPPCPVGDSCNSDFDCKDLLCDAGACAVAPFPLPCNDVDAKNPNCGDCHENGQETDVDCGGDACAPCAFGQGCLTDVDCVTGHCEVDTCAAAPGGCAPLDVDNPQCADCVQNGLETGVDCGGDACDPCGPGIGCLVDGDCATLSCVGGTCATIEPQPQCPPDVDEGNPTCADCSANGAETDVDCGGDSCQPCKDGSTCDVDGDCVSEVCDAGICG